MDLDDGDNRRLLVKDLTSASRYFDDEHYLKIDGKAVVGTYLARDFVGDVYTAIGEVRRTLAKPLYIVGDVVWWREGLQRFRYNFRDRVRPYDGVTAYNMHKDDKVRKFEPDVDSEYQAWSSALSGTGVDFIPGIVPGFDDTKVPGRRHKPLPRSTDRFERQVQIAITRTSLERILQF
jgi:hypothetical protein